MAAEHSGPFRAKSLERLSSPERLDRLLQVVDQKSWLPLLTLAILVAILTAWAILGKIPVNVHGRGILIHPREVVELHSPGSGYLTRLAVDVNDVVRPGDVLALIARPDLEKQLELQGQKLVELTSQIRTASTLWLAHANLNGIPSGDGADNTVENYFDASRDLARDLRQKEQQSLSEEQQRLEEQERRARTLAEARFERLEGDREALESGLLSRAGLLEAEEDYEDSLDRVLGLELRLRELRTQGLEIEERYLGRLERISDREQQLSDIEREISRLQHALEEEARIVSDHAGRILELNCAVGEFLAPGDRIGSMTISEAGSPLASLTYFTVKDGKRLKPDMVIQVTPDTVARARFGSIQGTIESVSPMAVSLAEARSVIGNLSMAETLTSGGHRMQIHARLDLDDTTYSGFRWSSPAGPEMDVSVGTTTTARVAVDERAPITFVLPFLKSASGVD